MNEGMAIGAPLTEDQKREAERHRNYYRRVEALKFATDTFGGTHSHDAKRIVEEAKVFEIYLKGNDYA